MKMVSESIPSYTYGSNDVAVSPISLKELEQLKQSVGFSKEDERYLRMAGEVLQDQTKPLVDTWRGVIAECPHLAKHSRDPQGKPIPEYSENSGFRFQQWIRTPVSVLTTKTGSTISRRSHYGIPVLKRMRWTRSSRLVLYRSVT